MGNIPISNTINVSVSETPSGLANYSVNSVYLLTNEKPLSVEPYIWATNAQDIINEYGTNSKTAKIATGLFSPSNNLRQGGGQVLVMPYNATDATHTKVKTVAITEDIIGALQAVSNGKLTVAIDGVDYTAINLNFSAISQIDDIVTVLNTANLDCNISVITDVDTVEVTPADPDTETPAETQEVTVKKIQFESRRAGTAGTIVLKDTSIGGGVDINGSQYLNGATAVTTAGQNVTGMTLPEALAQAEEIGYCGGVVTTQISDNDTIFANAQYMQTVDHVYFECIQSLKDMGVIGEKVQSAGLTNTRFVAYSMEGDNGTRQAIGAYASIALSSNYEGSDTALTMNLKTLTGLVPDTHLSQTYYNLAKQYGVDIYGSTEGLSVTYSFSNGDYTDEAVNTLWMKKAFIVAGFNYLRQTTTKIPQTEAGMEGLKNAYRQVCEQAVRNGVIGTGLQWNNSIPFGNGDDFQANIEKQGYYIYSLPIAQQSQAEREQRKAPVVQIAIKLSGAIHSSDLIVNIQK